MQNEYFGIFTSGLGHAAEWLPYFVGILAFIVALNVLEAKFGRKKRGRWQRKSRWDRSGRNDGFAFPPPKQIPDAADQLRTVMRADFKAQPLLNKSEARLFKAIDKMVLELRPDWQVMAQVSLGEILRCPDKDAYLCINSKRVDLLIVDEECHPLHAIEYQGGAHFKASGPEAELVKTLNKLYLPERLTALYHKRRRSLGCI